jgi:hypothetical protein
VWAFFLEVVEEQEEIAATRPHYIVCALLARPNMLGGSKVGILIVGLKNSTVLGLNPEKIITELVQLYDQLHSECRVG